MPQPAAFPICPFSKPPLLSLFPCSFTFIPEQNYPDNIDNAGKLSLRLQLRAVGLRLERRGTGYLILAGHQVLFEGRRGAYELTLA